MTQIGAAIAFREMQLFNMRLSGRREPDVSPSASAHGFISGFPGSTGRWEYQTPERSGLPSALDDARLVGGAQRIDHLPQGFTFHQLRHNIAGAGRQ